MNFLRKLRRRALVIGHCAFALGVFAQTPSPPKPARLRFLFLDETAGAYAVKTGSTFRQISSTPYAISAEFTPADLTPLEIYKTNPAPDPVTGKTERVKIAGITPPVTTTAALFIITPRPQPAGTTAPASYSVEMIDSDARAAPAGSLRILNRGLVSLAAQIGTEQISANPGDTRLFKPVTDQRFRVRIKIAVNNQDGWKLIDDRIAKVRADTRTTGILVFSPSGMRHTYPEDEIISRGPPPPGHFWLTYTDTP